MKYGAKQEGSVLKLVLSYNDAIHFEKRGETRGDNVIVGGCGNALFFDDKNRENEGQKSLPKSHQNRHQK